MVMDIRVGVQAQWERKGVALLTGFGVRGTGTTLSCFVVAASHGGYLKIDVTAFMVWFVENYPDSVKIMRENSDYQLRFK